MRWDGVLVIPILLLADAQNPAAAVEAGADLAGHRRAVGLSVSQAYFGSIFPQHIFCQAGAG